MVTSRTAFHLSVFTVGYNLLEGLVSVVFSIIDGSPALLGFGADSFVESLSGMVMIWRFWKPEEAEAREQRAAQLVGVTFLILAAYVAYEAIKVLTGAGEPERSLAALIIALVSLVVMPPLFILKQRCARRLQSRSLLADSKQTLGCILLSFALLFGAGLNYVTGFWQADPIVALVIAAYLVREGYEALTTREVGCC